MANNRLFLLNKETKEAIMLAKSFGQGWEIWPSIPALEYFMRQDDWESAAGGGSSNLMLCSESDLPDDVRHVTQDEIENCLSLVKYGQ